MSFNYRMQEGVLLKKHSTFGIGGPAKYFVEVSTKEEIQEIFAWAHHQNLPFLVLGKGSNVLFDDRGYDGLVILNKVQHIVWEDARVTVGGGYSFSLLGVQSAKKGLSGLEFAAGIPGSVGGAVFMNAGASKQETQESVVSVEFIHADGTCQKYTKEETCFGYRTSLFQSLKGCIVEVEFGLHLSDEAREKQLDMIQYRMNTQPYKDFSAGCVFRNPSHTSAGALIEACQLKGLTIGGAQVSPKHANFIVNKKDAKAEDVLALIEVVQSEVFKKTGQVLEIEVKNIPYRQEL